MKASAAITSIMCGVCIAGWIVGVAIGALFSTTDQVDDPEAAAMEQFQEAFRVALQTGGPDLAQAGRAANNIGAMLLSGGELQRSQQWFDVAQCLSPEPWDALANSAVILIHLGRQQQDTLMAVQAVDIYRRILAHQPNHWMSWSNLGVALADLGRYDEAAVAYRRALELSPGDANTAANLKAIGR